MELFLVRHGQAGEAGSHHPDSARPLTEDGRREFRQLVKGLQELGIELDRIYSSPWARAAQTAELLEPLIRKGRSDETELLAQSPGEDLLQLIKGESVALVGHQPWMGETLSWLITGAARYAGHFDFKKGGVAFLEGELAPGKMCLRGFWAPRVLRKL